MQNKASLVLLIIAVVAISFAHANQIQFNATSAELNFNPCSGSCCANLSSGRKSMTYTFYQKTGAFVGGEGTCGSLKFKIFFYDFIITIFNFPLTVTSIQ